MDQSNLVCCVRRIEERKEGRGVRRKERMLGEGRGKERSKHGITG